MKITSAAFELSAPSLDKCPTRPLPEFALIGRSNVGKSSLINSLTQRRELARTSNTPGKTQLLNFYVINNAWRLVDLPGYGYAKVSRDQRADFNQTVARYLSERKTLRLVFVLLDSRLPLQPVDREFIQWLEGVGTPFALVFTKMDKHSPTQGRVGVEKIKAAIGEWRSELPPVFLTSAETGAGRSELHAAIDAHLR
ncbi:ribosome biogenesis GTP-binding protein YihA/YsxC [Opitutus sp. ER46]|uniref:ribosome biogenesis GTP-binding protein YihA/YsxC n=1 Tax=Opitutus sp. ER46 TaxID=2161864 RepID=UPI000D32557A|nr:ribosome biogenesis GTP-binding protein YihA/YsxC [Opitutus sp. ER46]PTY00151.1 YihA family ribosome biogenesis GTP-binding protein [Opitutus sp. ER46]